jgi:atrial natriuretic peptide-converting enzyme
MDLSDQNSTEFGQKAREYRERINLLISRSKFRKYYDGVEILALDGFIDEKNTLSKDLIIHFLLNFDASSTDSFNSVDELKNLFMKEFKAVERNYFKDLNINTANFQLKEISFTKLDDIFETSHININDNDINNGDIIIASEEVRNYSPRKCEPVTLKFCKNIGNFTTMPNLLGHRTQEEMQRDLISFREVCLVKILYFFNFQIIDSECFLHSYDFLCSLLQPSCQFSYSAKQNEIYVKPYQICRDYW